MASSQWTWACACQQAEVGPVNAVNSVDDAEEEPGNCLEAERNFISESKQETLGWGAGEADCPNLIEPLP